MSTNRQKAGVVFFGLKISGEAVQPGVGNGNDAEVRFDGGKGIGRRGRVSRRQRVKDGRFTDVGQSDNADFHGRRILANRFRPRLVG